MSFITSVPILKEPGGQDKVILRVYRRDSEMKSVLGNFVDFLRLRGIEIEELFLVVNEGGFSWNVCIRVI